MGKKRSGFMSSKIGDLFGEDTPPAANNRTNNNSSSSSSSMSTSSQVVDAKMDREFKSHFREVMAVGTTGLGKREKWEMKRREVEETGRLQKKNIKTPYNILINSKKKKKVMEEKRTQKLRELGLASKIIDGKASNKVLFSPSFLFYVPHTSINLFSIFFSFFLFFFFFFSCIFFRRPKKIKHHTPFSFSFF